MSRKTVEMTRGNPGIPKKKRGIKDKENVKKPTPRDAASDFVEMTFESDVNGLFAMMGYKRMPLSPYSHNSVSEGETWRCMIDHHSFTGDTLMPVELISSAPVKADCEYMANDGSDIFSEPEPAIEPVIDPVRVDDSMIRDLEEEVRKLKETNRILMSKAARVDELERKCESQEDELKVLRRTKDSLSIQVNSLNKKGSVQTALSNESLVTNYEDTIESKDYEIFLLREKLKSMGVDDLAVVSRMPKVPKVFLTGDDAVHCTFLEDGRYSVYISPRLKKIRVVPDEKGRIWCKDNTLHLRCIAGFSEFEKPRPLIFRNLEDAVEIDL